MNHVLSGDKTLFFVSIFLFSTILGLYVGYNLIPEVGETNPLTGGSVDDPAGSLYILAVVLVSTVVLLLVLRFYRGRLLFLFLEIYIVFIGSFMVWQFVLFDILKTIPFVTQEQYMAGVIIVSALTVAVRFIRRTFAVKNITLAIAIAGAGGTLGSFMGFLPSLLLVVALGTYDIIAVFKTGHMIKLADQSRLREIPVMFETPSKGIKTGARRGVKKGKDVLGLGTGDIAIPLIFFVSILRTFRNWLPVLGAVVGATIGLGLTIYYVTQIRRVALPALPPIIGLSIGGFLVSLLLI